MGKLNFLCTDCHQTKDHVVQGKLLADNYTIDPAEQVACEDCHQGTVHSDERITMHTDSVACQTCHVPAMALKDPTKTFWDWSTAGQDLPEDHYSYLKIKGNFEYQKDVLPTYQWFNGNIAYRYLLGDPIDPSKTTDMVIPAGDIDDPTAKIFPFKIHTANQPYDTVNNILIPPRTAGKGGFWTTFDWPSALVLGAQDAIHAERGLKCTDCHYSLNNPVHYQETQDNKLAHLIYDPRRLEIGEYIERPDHTLARGQSAQSVVAPESKATMRRCESCHDAVATHKDWLPYAERHMQEVACETCHVPQLHAPAIQSYDWTVIKTDGSPVSVCRGIDGESTVTDLVTGYQPALMQRTNVDGQSMLAPYNLISSWFWVYEDANGNVRPVRQLDLELAYLENGAYRPEIIAAFDCDGDGALAEAELAIDFEATQAAVLAQLEALGLRNPRIYGQVQPYSINHNVVRGDEAISDCQTCHTDDSILIAPIALAGHVPGGVMPEFVQNVNVTASGDLALDAGMLTYQPDPQADGVYIFGHNRVIWLDWLGALIFVSTLLIIAAHATMRFISTRRRPKQELQTERVYMYDAYERFWHWLQTVTIILLLLTGLVIHRPDLFGMFSFPHMVTLHNLLAIVLIANAGLALFWHLASGQIRQFIPRPYGFFDQAIVQAKFYLHGIFKGHEHPFDKTLPQEAQPFAADQLFRTAECVAAFPDHHRRPDVGRAAMAADRYHYGRPAFPGSVPHDDRLAACHLRRRPRLSDHHRRHRRPGHQRHGHGLGKRAGARRRRSPDNSPSEVRRPTGLAWLRAHAARATSQLQTGISNP